MSDDADDDPDAVPPDDPRSEGTARAPVETEWQRIGPELSADDLEAIGTRAINRVMAHTRLDFYLWVQCCAALHYLRLKDGLTTEQYYAVAERMGVGERDARRCKHITPDMLPDVVKFGEVEAVTDQRRRQVSPDRARWPNLGDIIRKFPAPAVVKEPATLPAGAKEDQNQAEERASNASAEQARKMAREASDQLVQQRQSAADAIRQKDLEIARERARADAAEQALQRVREELANSIESHATEMARLKAELDAARQPRDAMNNNSPDVEPPGPPTAAPRPPYDPDPPADANAAAPPAPDHSPKPVPDPTPDPDPTLTSVEPASDDQPPPPPPQSDPQAWNLKSRGRSMEEMIALEQPHGLKGWRGHRVKSRRRQLRADFLAWWDANYGTKVPESSIWMSDLWDEVAGDDPMQIVIEWKLLDPEPPEPDQSPPAAPKPPDPPPPSPSEPPVPRSDTQSEPEPQSPPGSNPPEPVPPPSPSEPPLDAPPKPEPPPASDPPEPVPPAPEPPEPEPEAPSPDDRPDNVVPLRPKSAADPKLPKSPNQPAQIDRDAILQDVAKLVITRVSVVRVRGTPDGLVVKAHSDNKFLFVDANWPPHPDVQGHFLLEIIAKHEGRILTRERPGEMASGTKIGDEHKIEYGNILWEAVTAPFAEVKSLLGAALKIAKADKEDKVGVTVKNGSVTFDKPSKFAFWRRDLEWLLRKNATAIRYCEEGIVSATVTGIAGDYIVTLRGTEA